MKRNALAGSPLAAMALLAAGCGGGGGSSSGGGSADSPADPSKVTGDMKVLTQRTDLVQDGTMKRYAAAFNKLYPKVHITFEGITDYEGEVRAVPTLRGAPLPSALKPFQDAGVKFGEMSQAKNAQVTAIDNQSEIGMTSKPEYRRHLIDVARGAAGGNLQGIFADLAKEWAAARKTSSP